MEKPVEVADRGRVEAKRSLADLLDAVQFGEDFIGRPEVRECLPAPDRGVIFGVFQNAEGHVQARHRHLLEGSDHSRDLETAKDGKRAEDQGRGGSADIAPSGVAFGLARPS